MSNVTVTPVVIPSIRSTQRSSTMKVSTLSLAVLAVFCLASAASAANVQSGIAGDTATIKVGETTVTIPTPHPSVPGLPGIGHISVGNGTLVSFDALQNIDDPAVTTVGTGEAGDWKRTHITPPPNVDPPHDKIGYFNFVQVATESVYFGEWSQEGNSSDSRHTVYYAGKADDVVNTLPTQTATYTVVGINNGGILNGSLTANFGGNNQLSGTFFNSDLTIDIAATINTVDASFSGGALANGIDEGTFGTAKGHFFGDGATALAGITDFASDSSLNTAFGGIKD